jgi:hypothetical protein
MNVKQFQELYFIFKSEDFDFDKSVKMVGVLTNKTEDEVEAMPMKQFNKQCAKIVKAFDVLSKKINEGKFQKFLFANGRIYRLNYDLNKASKYVEGMAFSKDVITEMHRLLATIAEPIKWNGKKYYRSHHEIAQDMEQVEFECAYNVAVFFCLQYEILMKVIQPYLISEAMKKGMSKTEATESITNFNSLLAGYSMPRWLQNLREYLLARFGI